MLAHLSASTVRCRIQCHTWAGRTGAEPCQSSKHSTPSWGDGERRYAPRLQSNKAEDPKCIEKGLCQAVSLGAAAK